MMARLMRTLVAGGFWRTALAVFDSLHILGMRPDTATTNAAIFACDAGVAPLRFWLLRRFRSACPLGQHRFG